MSAITLDTLRKEAKRQLQQLKELLQEAQQKDLVPLSENKKTDKKTNAIDIEEETFDTEWVKKTVAILDEENHKLDYLDMVLAVVGTMKAGKSTSINAIVGAEVLPNRNRPMTALPTLIRHTPNAHMPLLVLEKIKPLNDLLTRLEKLIKSPENQQKIADLQDGSDMVQLIDQIKQKKPFASRYKGEKEIFNFLKGLNDLVRLSATLEETFPSTEYASVESMPVIEVEFFHLKNNPVLQGRFSLLDTPGPNEAGQENLRHMFKEQLRKASAVLTVLDYTQLKSEADEQVREQLKDISELTQGRTYALVNKFDNKDHNSDDPEATKRFVARDLMAGIITENNVFPVSSLWGYLANRARNEIERNGKLTISEPWVTKFGEEAMGRSWRQRITNTEDAKADADHLWKDSGFSEPLEKVIVEAHRNAALGALCSAASKLETHSKKASNFLAGRQGSLKGNASEIEEEIKNLQRNIEKITNIEKNTAQSLENIRDKIQNDVNSTSRKIKEEIRKELNAYFKDGKRAERDSLAKKDGSRNSKKKAINPDLSEEPNLAGVFSAISSWFSVADSDRESDVKPDFTPGASVIKFDSRTEANDLMEKVENSIRYSMRKAEQSIKDCIEEGVDEYYGALEQERIKSLNTIYAEVQRSVDGLEININHPDTKKISMDTSVTSILRDAIQEKSKTVTRSRRQKNAWGTVCSWFGTDDWGWEDYETTEEYYQVDLEKISKSTVAGLNSLFSSAERVLNTDIYPQLQESSHSLFASFRGEVNNIRQSFEQGQLDKELEKEKRDALLNNLGRISSKIFDLHKEFLVMNDSVNALCRKEGVFIAQKS